MKRKIAAKQYPLVLLVIIITIMTTFYLSNWYKVSVKIRTSPSIISTLIPTITVENISEYVTENNDVLIYISVKNNKTKKIEKEIKGTIIESSSLTISYLDGTNLTKKQYKEISNYFHEDIIETDINILKFTNGKIEKVLYKKRKSPEAKDIKNLYKAPLKHKLCK